MASVAPNRFLVVFLFFGRNTMNALVKFIRDEDGVVTIEYVMLAVAVVAALALVLTGAGTTLSTRLTTLINSI